MELDELLMRDGEAAALFAALPLPVQNTLRRDGGHISTLAQLRERTVHMVAHDGPFYANATSDGTKLDPELKADWTREHQA